MVPWGGRGLAGALGAAIKLGVFFHGLEVVVGAQLLVFPLAIELGETPAAAPFASHPEGPAAFFLAVGGWRRGGARYRFDAQRARPQASHEVLRQPLVVKPGKQVAAAVAVIESGERGRALGG